MTMQIFAHRGASGVEPENTLRAIQSALDSNVDGIEIDVHEADGRLWVIHDRWLHRTTSGIGQITDHTANYLRSIKAGESETIPMLDEVLALTSGKCIINIELKGINQLSLLFSYLDEAINTTNLNVDNILLSSFDHHLLKDIHQQRPEFSIGALTASCPIEYAYFAAQLHAKSVHIDIDFINESFVNDAHKRNLKVYVYTVDQFEDIRNMHKIGVDGIFSNHPATAKEYLISLL